MKIQIKRILSIAAIVLASYEASASDLGKSYIKLQGAGNMPHNTTHKKIEYKGEASFGGSLGFGYKAMENIDIEVGVDYIHSNKYKYDIKSAHTSNIEAKMNIVSPKLMVYFNYKPSDNMGIYLGVGGGASFISGEKESKGAVAINKNLESKTSLFASAEAGISFYMDRAVIDLGYGIGYHGKPYDFDIIIHSAKIGVRYCF